MVRMLRGNRRRTNDNEQGPGAPLWMATYGDLVTQILIFFVLLFSQSNLDANKFEMALTSLQGSLGILEQGPAVIQGEFIESGEIDSEILSRNEKDQLEKLEEKINKIIEEKQLSGIEVRLEERGVLVRFTEYVLFDSGKADLKKRSQEILDEIAPILKESHRNIRVEGHTDNRPIHTHEFPSNWELSTIRAVNVVRYLIDKHNFSPYILSAAGYGEYRPIAPNDSDKNRALNRRVDIIILNSYYESKEPK